MLRGLSQEEVCCWLQRYTHVGEHHKKLQVKVRVVGSSPTRGSSAGWAQHVHVSVLCCFALFVCLTLLASFFLPSHLSFKKHVYTPLNAPNY